MKPTNVVAGVIQQHKLYLIAKRNRNKYFGLKWEFPGGKVEESESLQQALIREIYEELNIVINVQKKISEVKYSDKKINIIIHYYLCSIREGTIKLSEHEDFAWVEKKNLKKYDFVKGDSNILQLLNF